MFTQFYHTSPEGTLTCTIIGRAHFGVRLITQNLNTDTVKTVLIRVFLEPCVLCTF